MMKEAGGGAVCVLDGRDSRKPLLGRLRMVVRPLRVALVGAHGTGKTTLSKALVQRLSSSGLRVARLPEAPREICGHAGEPEFFRRGKNTPLRQSLILLVHLMQEFYAQFEGVDIVLSDRSLLDHWTYTIHLFEESWAQEGVRNLYESFIIEYCRQYDILFFLPVEFAVVDDGTREGDQEFQGDIQNAMLKFIGEHQLEAVVVRGSIEERTESCFNHLQSKLEELEKGGEDVRA